MTRNGIYCPICGEVADGCLVVAVDYGYDMQHRCSPSKLAHIEAGRKGTAEAERTPTEAQRLNEGLRILEQLGA